MCNQAFTRTTIGRVLRNDGNQAAVLFRTERGVSYTRTYERGGDDISIAQFREYLPAGGDKVFSLGPAQRQWGADPEGWT